MYLEFNHLKKEPFQLSSNPKIFFLSPSHREALATIIFGVVRRKGLMAVLGEAGLGKTTLLQVFLNNTKREGLKIITFFNVCGSFAGLLQTILQELGCPPATDDPDILMGQLALALAREYEKGQNVILLIDEAQNLSEGTLEQLRLVSNLEVSFEKLIQIVFVGQPELWDKLNRQKLLNLKQRIAVKATLARLTEEETLDYIYFRLEKAGATDRPLFTRGALKEICYHSLGIPRRINILCDNALITGFGYLQKPVTKKIVQEVVSDLEGLEIKNFYRWAVPSLAGALVLLLFLGFLVQSHFLAAKLEWPLFPQSKSSHSGTFLIGQVSEKGDSLPVQALDTLKKEWESNPQSTTPRRAESGNPVDVSISQELRMIETAPQGGQKNLTKIQAKPANGKSVGKIENQSLNQNELPGAETRIVKEGDSFFRMVLEVYGSSNQTLWNYVRQHNPRINDIYNLRVGEKIIFPEWKYRGKEKG
jgi:general secretion pathway protein A